MTPLWIGCSLLLVLGILFVAFPLLGQRSRLKNDAVQVTQDSVNVTITRERLQDLEAQYRSGEVAKPLYEQLRSELERRLLDEVDNGQSAMPQTKTTRGSQLWITGFMMVVLSAVSIAGYLQFGSYEELEQRMAMDASNPGQEGQVAAHGSAQAPGSNSDMSLDSMIERLESRLAGDPEDIDGRLLLARSYMTMRAYPEALTQYGIIIDKLETAGQPSASVYAQYAQAEFLQAGQQVTESVKVNLEKALALNPDDRIALGLAGVSAFRQGEYQAAISSWEKVIAQSPADPSVQVLRDGINEARRRLGQPVAPGQESDSGQGDGASQPALANRSQSASRAPDVAAAMQKEDSAAAAINVHVSLDPGLMPQVGPDDVLFVYARAIQGAPMPLAIVRKRVADLPLEVTLDDTLSMSPMARLSNESEVEVVARVSRSGTPQPQTGDLQGLVAPVLVASAEGVTRVVISEVIQ